MRTKERIIQTAIELFNRDGFSNVRIQHIAEHLEMSLGNFTYHYPKKDDLVIAVYEHLAKNINKIWEKFERKSYFSLIDNQIRFFFYLQEKFSFFYVDTLELLRAYPDIAARHREHIKRQFEQTSAILQLNVDDGNFDMTPKDVEFLTEIIWSNVVLWKTKNLIRGNTDLTANNMAANLWGLLQPYFTEKGYAEYEKLLKNQELS